LIIVKLSLGWHPTVTTTLPLSFQISSDIRVAEIKKKTSFYKLLGVEMKNMCRRRGK
jgi:hypothetical protein